MNAKIALPRPERSRLALLGALAAIAATAGCGHRVEVAGTEPLRDRRAEERRLMDEMNAPARPPAPAGAPDRTGGGGGGGGGGGH